MLPNISGGHTAYQNFVVTNLRKYYPNPDALAPSTWDIIERLWNSDNSHLSSHIHPIKEKVKKKGTKADFMEKVTVAELLPQLENTEFHIDEQPYSSLFKIYKLEDGRHRSTKMWYCRLYHILMLQHLDAWDLPYESPLRKLILQTA